MEKLFFIISIMCLFFGIKWLFDGIFFYGIFNTVLGIFNVWHWAGEVFKK